MKKSKLSGILLPFVIGIALVSISNAMQLMSVSSRKVLARPMQDACASPSPSAPANG